MNDLAPKRPSIAVCLLYLLVAPAALTAQENGATDSPPRPCPLSANDVQTVTVLIERWAERRRQLSDVPGLALGFVCGADRTWTRGFGEADRELGLAATDTTLFRIASISKVFTAIALLRLRDAGRLDLDDEVAVHLPWFRLANSGEMPPVTLRHLLTHTSGLPTNSAATDFNRMTQPVLDTMIARLGAQRLLFPPGREVKYSNLGFAVLGQVVAAVSGRPYGPYLEGEILAPLGMRQTVAHPVAGQTQATGYHAREPGRPRRRAEFIHLAAFTPAGGIATTAKDMATFTSFALATRMAPPVVLAPGTIREMQSVQHPSGTAGGGMGLAWAVDRGPEIHEVSHGGGLPTQASHLRLDLTNGLAAFALANAVDADPAAYVDEILALLRLAIDATNSDACTAPADGGSRYTGRYRWQGWELWAIRLGDCLWLIDPVGQTDPLAGRPSASATRLEPVPGHGFRATSGWVNAEFVEFVVDGETGAALHLKLPALAYQRAGDVTEPNGRGAHQ